MKDIKVKDERNKEEKAEEGASLVEGGGAGGRTEEEEEEHPGRARSRRTRRSRKREMILFTSQARTVPRGTSHRAVSAMVRQRLGDSTRTGWVETVLPRQLGALAYQSDGRACGGLLVALVVFNSTLTAL